MADPTRSRILLMLMEGPTYPAAVAERLGLTRQNVSNHLTCLRDCTIVTAEPEGRQVRYAITDPHISRALTVLLDVVLGVDESLPCQDALCPVAGCGEGLPQPSSPAPTSRDDEDSAGNDPSR